MCVHEICCVSTSKRLKLVNCSFKELIVRPPCWFCYGSTGRLRQWDCRMPSIYLITHSLMKQTCILFVGICNMSSLPFTRNCTKPKCWYMILIQSSHMTFDQSHLIFKSVTWPWPISIWSLNLITWPLTNHICGSTGSNLYLHAFQSKVFLLIQQ